MSRLRKIKTKQLSRRRRRHVLNRAVDEVVARRRQPKSVRAGA
jgi:hypothetical protein